MKISSKQMDAVLRLSGAARFEHFVKVVADRQEAWGLYDGGWALAATDDGTPVFPLWPASEYAEICAEKEWTGHVPRSMTLVDLVDLLLPRLRADGVLPGVFSTPSSKGVTLSCDELRAALDAELAKY